MRAEADDKRKRVIAFILITVVFLISVAALLYWAINVAAAHISSRVTTHVDALKTLSTVGVWVSTASRENSAKLAFASMASQVF